MGKTMFGLTVLALSSACVFAADAKGGRAVYEQECVDCHAMNGAPIGSVAKSMKNKGVIMRDLAGKEVQGMTSAEWRKSTVEGVGKMKGITTIDAAQMEDLFAFMRAFKKK